MEILQQIFELDKAASAAVKKTCEAELNRLDARDEENARGLEQMVKYEQAQAEEFRRQHEERLSRKKADTEATLTESVKRLEEIFAAHREEWQSEIIRRITGV